MGLAMIYDPLSFMSAVPLAGKIIFRDVCNVQVNLNEELPESLKKRCFSWIRSLPEKVEIARSIPKGKKEIKVIDLYAFADANLNGVAAIVLYS